MNGERGYEELAAQSGPCWRLVTAPACGDSERLEHLQWAHYRDADEAIDAAQELAGEVEGWDELLTFTAAVRAGLAEQRDPCWVVRCRECGTPLGDDEDDALAVLHFDDPTAAYEAAERQFWTVEVRGGTRMVCPPCQWPDERARAGTSTDDMSRAADLGDVGRAVDRAPGPGQLAFTHTGTDPAETTVAAPYEDAADVVAAPADAADPAAPIGEAPAEFLISRCLWPQVAATLVRGGDPGPRPAVFSPDRVEAFARTAPETALCAVRAAVGWARAPHDLRDLAVCLEQWRVEPRDGHFVKAEHAAVGHGRARVAVAPCGDCGYPVTRRGGATARWVPIWPHPGPPESRRCS